MKQIYNLLLAGVLILAILFMGLSCSHDEDVASPTPEPIPTEGQSQISLEVRIPGLLLPSAGTYGMTSTMEEAIKELSLLAYVDAGGIKQLKINKQLTTSDFTSTASGITVTVKIDQGKYDKIVLIANANTQAATLAANSNYAALNALSYSNGTDKWSVTSPTHHIPMSASLDATTANGLDITNSRTFKGLLLTRMLAKIDIVNSSTSSFTLKNVYVYNMNKNGTIVADKATYGAIPKAEKLPSPLTKITNPLDYNFASLATTNGANKEMKGEIYVFEGAKANKTTTTTMKASPRIIIKGTYGATDYYYPVDFTYSTTAGTVNKGDFMPLVRNHEYTFTISKVSGIGFATPDAAMEHLGSFTNIQTITHKIEADYTDVYYDGQHYLAVNTTGVEKLMGSAAYVTATADNTIAVLTNAATFTIECYNSNGTPATPATMRPNSASYAGNNTSVNAHLLAAATPTTADEFEGYAIVKAGGLESERIPIHKCICGRIGIPLPQTIGTNVYKTHAYPTGTAGAMQCWMVENSKEGVGMGKGYGLNWAGGNIGTINSDGNPSYRGLVNGYYYTWVQAMVAAPNAAAPCPTGWSLPNQPQWTSLVTTVNANQTDPSTYWWQGAQGAANNAFAGYAGSSGATWNNWGTSGKWWSSSATYQTFHGYPSRMNGPSTTDAPFWFSVRCVQN